MSPSWSSSEVSALEWLCPKGCCDTAVVIKRQCVWGFMIMRSECARTCVRMLARVRVCTPCVPACLGACQGLCIVARVDSLSLEALKDRCRPWRVVAHTVDRSSSGADAVLRGCTRCLELSIKEATHVGHRGQGHCGALNADQHFLLAQSSHPHTTTHTHRAFKQT
jgi:hypothetical protein